MPEKIAPSLQLSVLAALCINDTIGAQIAAQVEPAYFDDNYRELVAVVLRYRRRYRKAPGIAHVDDLVEQVPLGRDQRTYLKKHVLPQIKASADSVNVEYAATRVDDFVRRQTFKGSVSEAIDRFNRDDEELVSDLEGIFQRALVTRRYGQGAGLFMNNSTMLTSVLERPETYKIGIKHLDLLGIGPAPRQMLLYIAAKNTGKTWFCVHVGRYCAINQHLKVVHISLEMDRLNVAQRYIQTMFAVSDSPAKSKHTVFEFDEFNRFAKFHTTRERPQLDLTNPRIKTILKHKLARWGMRLGNIVIVDFPTGWLTLDKLASYLDYLEQVEGFIPNVLIVDYPDLMKVDPKNYRLDIGYNYEGVRGIGVARNLAVVVPSQGSRISLNARHVKSSMAAEDIRKVNAADNVLTYSCTKYESQQNIARLSVEHARYGTKGHTILLSQSYSTGQYVLDSAWFEKAYWEQIDDDRHRRNETDLEEE